MRRAAPLSTSLRRLLSEPPRPSWIRDSKAAPWLAVGAVCIGAFMGQLDASIVTVALPSIARGLHSGLGATEWVVLAYVVALVATVAVIGRVADAAGRKLLYAYGFAVFAAASAGCALAPSLGILVLFRVIQGVGAAMLQANSLALIRDVAPPGRLGTATGVQGAAQAVGLAAGPSIGGLLVSAGGWPLIFVINVPVGAVGLVLAWFLLPRSRHRSPASAIDVTGAVVLAAGAACLLALLSLAVEPGVSAAPLAATAAGAAVFGAGAVARQRSRPGSVADVALLRSRAFVFGASSGLVAYAALFGTLLVVPFFLEASVGLSARDAGIRLTALPVALAAVAPLGGRLADRYGARLPTVAGMAVAAAGLALLAIEGGGLPLVVSLAVVGAGFGLFIPANNAAVVGGAPEGHAGAASGLLNLTRGLGTAFGVGVAGLVYGLVAATGTGAAAAPGSAAAGARAAAITLSLVALASGALASLRDEPPFRPR